jgi:hypothetical protein
MDMRGFKKVVPTTEKAAFFVNRLLFLIFTRPPMSLVTSLAGGRLEPRIHLLGLSYGNACGRRLQRRKFSGL